MSTIFHGVFTAPRAASSSEAISRTPPTNCAVVAGLHWSRLQSAAAGQEKTMGNFIGFAEVAAAIIAAFGLALGLEWVGLYGLTSMVPGRRNQPNNGAKSRP
jgi:hypothetical protein